MSLTLKQISENKRLIENELMGVRRRGIGNIIEFLNDNGFFTQAASTKWHQAYKGGLAEHSLEVLENMIDLNEGLNLGFNRDSMVIVSILHDVCKIDSYIESKDGSFRWNENCEKGHSLKSIKIIKQFIKITEEEEEAIKFHMGAYEKKEYTWSDMGESYNKYPMSYYAHVADMRSAYGF